MWSTRSRRRRRAPGTVRCSRSSSRRSRSPKRERGRTLRRPRTQMPNAGRSPSYRIAQLAGWLMLLSVLGVLAYGAFNKGPSCLMFSEELIGTRVFEAPPCQQLESDVVLYEAHIETDA